MSKRNSTTAEVDVIATRALVRASDGARATVTLFRPELESESDPPVWQCRVIVTGAVSHEEAGHGVDALQALVNAVASLRRRIDAVTKGFEWSGSPGVSKFPLVIQGSELHLQVIDHLAAAEAARESLWLEDMIAMRRDRGGE